MKTGEIAEFLGCELLGDADVEIVGVADVETATATEIAFANNAEGVGRSAAGCLIVPLDSAGEGSTPRIKAPNPKLAFSRIASVLHASDAAASVHPTAVIAESAVIGKNVNLAAFVVIGESVHIGDGCVLHPHVVIGDRCSLGNNVILHPGVVIGADGFGYVQDEQNNHHKFPQIGTVVIEDNVEIGANTCIDRGALGETRIGEGTKIDNLVQIAHNVQIGKRVIIAAQTGISGSTVIEDDCVIGGQVGMGDHALVKSGAVIGSQAGVLPGKIVRPGVWWGTPVQPLDMYKKQNAHLKGIGRLKEEVKALKKDLKN